MATEFAKFQSIGLSCDCGGHDAWTLSEIHAKTDQNCPSEDCLAIGSSVRNDLSQEFIDKAIPSFQKRL